MPPQDGPRKQLARIKQMPPVRPAASTNRFVIFCTSLNLHVRQQACRLPVRQMGADVLRHPAFPFQIRLRHGPELGFRPSGFLRLPDPLHAVEPLLQDVLRAGDDVLLFPRAQAVAVVPLFIPVIPADGAHPGAVRGNPVRGMNQRSLPHPGQGALRLRPFLLLRPSGRVHVLNGNVIPLADGVRNQPRHHPVPLADHQRGQHGHHPAGLGAAHLQAIQVSPAAPAAAVPLHAQGVHLPRQRARQLTARLLLPRGVRLGAARHMKSAPAQQAGHGVQVRRARVTAQPRRLKGDLPAAAEGIRHAGAAAIARHAQLLHQLREGACLRPQAGVHLIPDALPKPLPHFLRPFGFPYQIRVAEFPAPVTLHHFRRQRRAGTGQRGPQARLQRLRVHPHQALKQAQVPHIVPRGGQQRPQHACLVQNERLAPLPICSD